MNEPTIKTPGVYINEKNAFPNSVVPVPTAVPAFIGYTPQAQYDGKSFFNVPQKITSFSEFKAFYCYPDPAPPASPAKQYRPEYYLVKEISKPEQGNFIMIGSEYYSIVPDPNTIYYLYNCVRMFYDNGGGDAYIISVGTYGKPSKTPLSPGNQIINSNVDVNELLGGLALLKSEKEPTMYICPEATLLSVENNGKLMQEMLLQNTEMQTAMSIFDIIGGRNPDPIKWTEDITVFRNQTGESGLNFGTAYYPFIGTSTMQNNEIDYTNLFGGDVKQLKPLLNPPTAPNLAIKKILSSIENPSSTQHTVSQYHNALMSASKTYTMIIEHVLSEANVLPASGAMAGVITTTDNQTGPWQAPANTSIVGAVQLPIKLSDEQQEGLNIDPVSGKSINAIRYFNGMGILIWGARTLDGNSSDWKYVPIRRTMTFIEQSCKLAARAYVFEPNNKNTWEAVKAMISSFLTSLWKQGGLQGSTPSDAFSIACGLGSTMTSDDLLNGLMRVTVNIALVHPAEFLVFSIEQEMAQSSS